MLFLVFIISLIQYFSLAYISFVALQYYSLYISKGLFGLFIFPYAVMMTLLITGLVIGVARVALKRGINKYDLWFLTISLILVLITLFFDIKFKINF